MTMGTRRFAQVDVFTSEPYRGNPVAVVLDGDGVDDDTMARFAKWTNLSETTFVQTATTRDADYKLRIFTPGGEIPFAGHPTLGSAHAWLASADDSSNRSQIVQECGVGLVTVKRDGSALSFRAPNPVKSGPLDEEYLEHICAALRIHRDSILDHQWVDNGPGWAAVRLSSASEVLELEPDETLMKDLILGVVGPHPDGFAQQFEVRSFALLLGIPEDPVTGSLNAGIGQWLIRSGVAPSSYRARQGTVLGRHGIISVADSSDGLWVGGESVTCIDGNVSL
ncbi:phenazine biosynthesis protein PhzF [Rhodococcus sp. 06-1477-1A]|nr:phenazine biosynthesis protein PhzF [Rhodococcus sp. 06-1477-1A]